MTEWSICIREFFDNSIPFFNHSIEGGGRPVTSHEKRGEELRCLNSLFGFSMNFMLAENK